MQYSNFPDLHHYANLDKNLLIIEVVAYAFGHLLLTKMSKVEIAHSGAIIIYNFEIRNIRYNLDSAIFQLFGRRQTTINFTWSNVYI